MRRARRVAATIRPSTSSTSSSPSSRSRRIATPILEKIGAEPSLVASRLEDELRTVPKVSGAEPYLANRLAKLIDRAEDAAKRLKDEYVSTEHLLLAAAEEKTGAGEALRASGATPDRIRAALQDVRGGARVTSPEAESQYRALEKYARDLTELARAGKLDPVIGRDDEIRRVIQILSRRTKNNPVLVGDPGVGKTAIVEGLARRIVDGDVPEGLKGKRLLALDLGAMVAGAKYRGEFETGSCRPGEEESEGTILFIDEPIPSWSRAAEAAMDAGTCCRAGSRRTARREPDARRVPQVRREGPGPRAPVPAGLRRRAVRRGHDLDPPRPAGALRGPPRREDH
jgi:ATP-dependent Clp protease ATP-binding subunit ClpB